MDTRKPAPEPRRLTRRDFLTTLGGAALAAGGAKLASAAQTAAAALAQPEAEPAPVAAGPLQPAGFVAHGAPLLALDDVKGADLSRWTARMPKPRKILVVSAHWERAPASLGPTEPVPLIYDFYGFPQELYTLEYPAPANVAFARQVEGLLKGVEPVERQPERGLDHGTWVPLRRMYPDADIPVIQLSLPTQSPDRLFRIGRALAPLRREGVLILGSGNLTHNLRMADWRPGAATPAWAAEFDAWIKGMLVAGNVDAILDYDGRAPAVATAHPTREHFVPLLVALGAASADPKSVSFPIEGFEFGSIARRTVQFG